MRNYTPLLIDKIKKRKSFVAGSSKEGEPVSLEQPGVEYSAEDLPEKSAEKKETEVLIEERQEEIRIDEDLKKAGLRPIQTSIKFDTQRLKFPISDEKIWEGLHAPVDTSLRWLAEFAVYILRKFNLKLKKVNGKVVRVFSG